MTIEFNPRKKSDDKGVGKIKIDEMGKDETAPSTEGKSTKKWIVAGIGGVVLLGLAGVFALSAGDNDNTPAPAPVPPIVQTVPSTPVTVPARPVEPVAPTAAQLREESIDNKMQAIYRNSATLYRDHSGNAGEAYITTGGRQVRAGNDFALYVALHDMGTVSVLVAEGPYAGARVTFFPTENRMTYDKMGGFALGADGKTPVFTLSESFNRSSQTLSMSRPQMRGHGVSVAQSGRQVEKIVQEDGHDITAFIVTGSPERDGKFTVQIWNGDSYSVDLSTGEYAIDSAFLANPDYQEDYERTGREVTPAKVQGVMTVAPATRPITGPRP
jgi:hypothetical protein